jgi:hypothetical protein
VLAGAVLAGAVLAGAVPGEAGPSVPRSVGQVQLPPMAAPLRVPAVAAVDSLASLLLSLGLPGDLSDQSAAGALP